MASVQIIHRADPKTLEEVVENNYKTEVLQVLYRDHLKSFIFSNQNDFKEAGLTISDFSNKVKREKLIKLMAAIYAYHHLFDKLLFSLSSSVADIFSLLIWEGPYKVTDIEKEFKVKIFAIPQDRSLYYYDSMKYLTNTSYLFFCFQEKWGSGIYNSKRELNMFLPDQIRKVLKTYFTPPDGYHLIPLTAISSSDFIFESKGSIFKELPLYYEYVEKGIKYTKSGKPLKSSVQNFKKYSIIQEFYKSESKDLECLKTNLMISLIKILIDTEKQLKAKARIQKLPGAKEPEKELQSLPFDLLKRIIEFLKTTRADWWILDNLLFHLKGRSNIYINSLNNKIISANLFSLLLQLSTGQWISVSNLSRFVLLRDIDLTIVDKYSASRYFYVICQTGKESKYGEAIYITEDRYHQAIVEPILKGTIFLWAGLGLVDIAYDLPTNETIKQVGLKYLSVFDGVKYLRLTDLGAYIIGRTKEYSANIIEEQRAEVVLDENCLIISLVGEDRLKRMILARFADYIGGNRYKMEFSSLLRDCISQKDVQKKISQFKTEICANPPKIWLDFFQRALNRIHPLKQEQDMMVYKISEDKELIHLIATDPILKQYVLKVEKFYIAVNRYNFPKVKQRLEGLGYLI